MEFADTVLVINKSKKSCTLLMFLYQYVDLFAERYRKVFDMSKILNSLIESMTEKSEMYYR